jgi:hypothetical protein
MSQTLCDQTSFAGAEVLCELDVHLLEDCLITVELEEVLYQSLDLAPLSMRGTGEIICQPKAGLKYETSGQSPLLTLPIYPFLDVLLKTNYDFMVIKHTIGEDFISRITLDGVSRKERLWWANSTHWILGSLTSSRRYTRSR